MLTTVHFYNFRQYIANYLADVTDIFVWLGAYKKDGKWIYEDDSDGTYNLNAIEAILKSAPDGSCLCAEPKTLGVWFTRECSASSGAAICEMEPIRKIFYGNHFCQ